MNINNINNKDTIYSLVYNAVHRANKLLSKHNAIQVPDMVYILPVKKHLPLTGKGTVSRSQAMDEFHQEIEQMYRKTL